MRLQRYLAASGIASRRRSEELIAAGLVRVNGRVVRELGTSVEATDVVEYAGAVVERAVDRAYLIMHKPLRVMTTMRDPEGRRTVADLLREHGVTTRVVPVGRLDYDTSGVLLLSDDGDLAHRLTHPKYGVDKTYRATVRGRLDAPSVERVLRGVRLDDGRAQPAQLRVVAVRREGSVVDLTIHEGRNRQVRRMFEEVGHPVLSLARIRFGPVSLGDLAVGQLRPATEKEVSSLMSASRENADEAEDDDAS